MAACWGSIQTIPPLRTPQFLGKMTGLLCKLRRKLVFRLELLTRPSLSLRVDAMGCPRNRGPRVLFLPPLQPPCAHAGYEREDERGALMRLWCVRGTVVRTRSRTPSDLRARVPLRRQRTVARTEATAASRVPAFNEIRAVSRPHTTTTRRGAHWSPAPPASDRPKPARSRVPFFKLRFRVCAPRTPAPRATRRAGVPVPAPHRPGNAPHSAAHHWVGLPG